MLSAISAESLKLRRHRATWLLVWIFPLGVLLFGTLAIAVELVTGNPAAPAAPELGEWLENASGFWNAPRNSLVRYLICAFIAVVFGGEYGWNTWKLIVPHRARPTLIAAKYAVSIALLYAAFIAAALVMMGITWLEDVLSGDPLPQGITFGSLAEANWLGFLATLAPVLLTIAYASFAAILTRSTTAALVIGIVVTTLEQLFRTFGPLLSFYMPVVVEFLYHALPGYHLANLTDWIVAGTPEIVPFPSGKMVSYGWEASLAIVAAWTVALVVLTFLRFRRQDIN
jgi:ABC-type transport system involved in multi-copper enzyme maturation permease subunit